MRWPILCAENWCRNRPLRPDSPGNISMVEEKIDYNKEFILIVDDDFYLRETFGELLQSLGFNVGSASSGMDAIRILKEKEYTFVLTDMKMPEMDGFELIKKVKDGFPEINMIAMTGYSDGYGYVDVINTGASDFIKKPFQLDELEAKVRRIIRERDLRTELNRLSITDSLTGLFNQRHFYSRMNEEVIRAERQKKSLALILLDLDNFKEYNDAYGHLEGDNVLRNVGKVINLSIREGVDSGYRYGGDEFAVILIEADISVAEEIGSRVQQSFKEKVNITASIGFAMFKDGMSVKDLVGLADKNLYRSKDTRKNTAAG